MFTTEQTQNNNQGWADIYRPTSLKDVVGQDRIIKEIVKKLNTKGLPSNILITGGSGTGKTTLGIIIAQTLNCKSLSTETIDGLTYKAPCGVCKSCRAIQNNESNSGFHFYDGAELGKDKILEIKNLCNSPNLYQGKRIIFIDELQNVGGGKDASIQTLLKVVEHDYKGSVHFIFSSMNPKKINKALQDRFHLHLKLKPVSSADLISRASVILKAEGLLDKIDFSNLDKGHGFMYDFLREGLTHLASSVDGSVREFIQHLETCVNREIGLPKDIEEELELMSVDSSSDILSLLVAKDPKFFEAIIGVKAELESFFNLSYNTLTDYFYYKASGTAQLSWQKGKYDIWIKKYNSNIIQLTEVYNKIFESSIYYKKSYLISKLVVDYFESTPIASTLETKVIADAVWNPVHKSKVRTRQR